MKMIPLTEITTADMIAIVKYNKEHSGTEGMKVCTIGEECYVEDPRED